VETVIPDDCVFISDTVKSVAREVDQDGSVNGISEQMAGVSFKSPASRQQQQQQQLEQLQQLQQMEQLQQLVQLQQMEQLQQMGNSPHGWAQLRRQSDSFHFVRPSDRR
jgi:hypothetical protein